MFRFSVIALLLATYVAVSAQATNRTIKFNCGSHITKEQIHKNAALTANLRTNTTFFTEELRKTKVRPINTYWHVVHNTTKKAKDVSLGWLTDETIAAQMKVLNADFASTGISFRQKKVTRIRNGTWFERASTYEPEIQTDMKLKLRRGSNKDLNIYTVGFTAPSAGGLLGYATFPEYLLKEGGEEDDGVVVTWGSLPGGQLAPYDKGRTLTHEVGHWVGLFHTFQDGCEGGDLVSDTAPEAQPAFGCPIGRDTCPDDGPGLVDPVTNFLDYSDDDCMTEFTLGQAVRAKEQMLLFRGAKL